MAKSKEFQQVEPYGAKEMLTQRLSPKFVPIFEAVDEIKAEGVFDKYVITYFPGHTARGLVQATEKSGILLASMAMSERVNDPKIKCELHAVDSFNVEEVDDVVDKLLKGNPPLHPNLMSTIDITNPDSVNLGALNRRKYQIFNLLLPRP